MGKRKELKIINETSTVMGSSPADMIRMAVSGGADLEALEKLLTLQERYEANEARKAYHSAMAEFKKNPPRIDKDKTVGYESKSGAKVGYSHASLGNVVEKVSTELSKHGLSASWSTKQNGSIAVTCKITHVKGHSEETTISAEADTSGAKNSIQAIGSTITYLERYSLLSLAGLATYDDDDGKASGAPAEYITAEEVKNIETNLDDLKIKQEQFLAYMKVATLEEISKPDYAKAVKLFDERKARAK
jgi:hypothetical protein